MQVNVVNKEQSEHVNQLANKKVLYTFYTVV